MTRHRVREHNISLGLLVASRVDTVLELISSVLINECEMRREQGICFDVVTQTYSME